MYYTNASSPKHLSETDAKVDWRHHSIQLRRKNNNVKLKMQKEIAIKHIKYA